MPTGRLRTRPVLPPNSGDNVVSAQGGITVPLLEQLAIGGGITAREGQAIEGELSLSVSPFAAGDPTYPEEEAYGKALVAWQTLRQQTYFDAEQAVLAVLIGEMERELARMTFELEQKRYETVRKELELLFDPDSGEVEPAPLSLQRLEELISNREEQITTFVADDPSCETLECLKLKLAALRAELKATPLWRPDFDLTGSVGLADPSVCRNNWPNRASPLPNRHLRLRPWFGSRPLPLSKSRSCCTSKGSSRSSSWSRRN